MRQRRIKAPPQALTTVYHCVSRVTDGRRIFGPAEKEQFLVLLREYEQFSGVQILTYCLMSDHFHLLIRVLPQNEHLSNDEVLQRVDVLTSAAITGGLARVELKELVAAKDIAGMRAYLERLHDRLGDVSGFVRMLKQRFSRFYNIQMGRGGTLWQERFNSVLVEDRGEALLTVAAYIDLNPVRAGLVKDPGAYQWCGYGEAKAGRRQAKEGLRWVYEQAMGQPGVGAVEALQEYAALGFVASPKKSKDDAAGETKGLAHQEVLDAIQSKERVDRGDYLRCRVRYFSDGLAVGSREFVEAVFQHFRGHFSKKRTSGARRMEGLKQELYSARDLKVKVFG